MHNHNYYISQTLLQVTLINHICDVFGYLIRLLAYLSRRLKWAFLITICQSSVVVIVVVVVVKLFTFSSPSPKPLRHSQQLGTKHPWLEGIQLCSNEGPNLFSRGDNYEIPKIHLQNLKIFFSRTTWTVSTKLGMKHPWMKGINSSCSNEELFNPQKEDM